MRKANEGVGRGFRGATGLVLTATLVAGFLIFPQQPAQGAPVDCSRGVNLGFETPLVSSNPMGPLPNWALFDESLVPGWSTTATDDLVELWESTFLGVTSYAGDQHAEMNATQPSTFSQDLATLAGDSISWSVAHRGRTAPTDSADLRFGAPGAPTVVQVMVSSTAAWSLYSGTYVVPAGQTTTQISFVSNDPGSLGNFLDGIELALVCDISVTTTFGGFTDVDFSGHVNPGDTADFEYLVENLGTATVETLQVSDSLGFLATCAETTLMPGESTTCSGTFVLTAAEIDSGALNSVVTATAEDAEGVVVSAEDSATEVIVSEPTITLDKSGSLNDSLVAPSGRVDVGDAVDYTLTVTNTGNVTLDPLNVTDDTAGTVACPGSSLASGETMICTANVPLAQSDIDAGSVSNTASAAGNYGSTVVSAVDSATVALEPAPGIGVVKVGAIDNTVVDPVSRTDVGDVANYTMTVVNTGNVTLDPVAISDPLAAVTCGASALTPGGTMVCTASVTLDQMTIDAGILTNTVVATANPPGADPGDQADDVSSSGTETLVLIGQPLVGLAKSLESTVIRPDGTIEATFRYSVENFGNVTVADLKVTDDVVTLFGELSPGAFSTADGTLIGSPDWDGTVSSNLLAPGQSLAPGERGDVLAMFSIIARTEATIDNVATVFASSPDDVDATDESTDGTDPDPDGDSDPTNNSDPTTLVVPRLYDLAVVKTARSIDPESSRIEWAITVTNNGPGAAPRPISVVEVADDGLVLETAGGSGWSCEMRDTSGTCTFGESLAVGDSSTFLVSSKASVANRVVVSNTAVLQLPDSGDLDPSNNVAAASVVIGDLPFTGLGAALLVIAATILCTLGVLLVVVGRHRDVELEEMPHHRG